MDLLVTRGQLVPSLVETVEEFKTTLLEVDGSLRLGRLQGASAQLQVSSACDAVERALREQVARDTEGAGQIGAYVFREIFPYLTQSRFVDRAFTKPRGYAGDYATIEMLYEDNADGEGRLGPLIDRWTRDVPARLRCSQPTRPALPRDSRGGDYMGSAWQRANYQSGGWSSSRDAGCSFRRRLPRRAGNVRRH